MQRPLASSTKQQQARRRSLETADSQLAVQASLQQLQAQLQQTQEAARSEHDASSARYSELQVQRESPVLRVVFWCCSSRSGLKVQHSSIGSNTASIAPCTDLGSWRKPLQQCSSLTEWRVQSLLSALCLQAQLADEKQDAAAEQEYTDAERLGLSGALRMSEQLRSAEDSAASARCVHLAC